MLVRVLSCTVHARPDIAGYQVPARPHLCGVDAVDLHLCECLVVLVPVRMRDLVGPVVFRMLGSCSLCTTDTLPTTILHTHTPRWAGPSSVHVCTYTQNISTRFSPAQVRLASLPPRLVLQAQVPLGVVHEHTRADGGVAGEVSAHVHHHRRGVGVLAAVCSVEEHVNTMRCDGTAHPTGTGSNTKQAVALGSTSRAGLRPGSTP